VQLLYSRGTQTFFQTLSLISLSMYCKLFLIISQIEIPTNEVAPTLLSYTRQIASGLVYLEL